MTQTLAQHARDAAPAGPLRAYEVKFLLSEEAALGVQAWAGAHLALDPHADATLGGYRTSSVYLDTADLDVYHGTPGVKRRKFRVRRYGAEAVVHLERKARTGDRVRKRRTCVPEAELARLEETGPADGWAGEWFRTRLRARGLRPVCLIAYDRAAYGAMTPNGPVRLTLDRRVRGVSARSLAPGPVAAGLPLLSGEVILELKFQAVLPALFKRLILERGLSPSPVSKYRLCVGAWGLAAPAKGAAGA